MTAALKNHDSPIYAAAKTWIGTPFHHQGRVKGVGVDCLGLLVGVARELDLRDAHGRPLADFDALDYGHMPDEKRLWRGLNECLNREKIRITNDELRPSQAIGLFRIDGTARHLGIIGRQEGHFTLIHAYAPARKVVEHRLDEVWRARLVVIFTLSTSYQTPGRIR